MLVMYYNLDKIDLVDANKLFKHITEIQMNDETLRQEGPVIALPDFCSIAKMDIYELEAIRNMINKMIEIYKESDNNGAN